MSKNRKKSETYRFNGLWGMTPVKVDQLKSLILKFESKLSDPDDPDDKKWTKRWLDRFEKELHKKQDSLERRRREVSKTRPQIEPLRNELDHD